MRTAPILARLARGASLIALSGLTAVASAGAQTATPAPEPTQDEVLVTATKQGASSIHDVPISIQALDSSDLAKRGAIDFNDFARLVPGLTSQDTGPGDKRYIIRGITSSGPGTVGVYLDEAIITGENAQDGGGQQTDIKLFDVERVEVLKGPQGTTFGSSSLGGTIRYITNKPDLTDTSVTAAGDVRATRGASIGYQVDGAANLVVVPDRIAVRVAGFRADLPGYIDSRFGKGVDGELTTAVRGSARALLADDLTLTVMGMFQKTTQDSKAFFNRVDFFGKPAIQPFYQTQVARTPFYDKNQIYSGVLDYDRDFGTITATASRYVRDLNYVRDASPFAALLLGLAYPDPARSVISQPKHRRVDTYELRYNSKFGGPVEILVGAFGSDEHRFFRSNWLTVNSTGAIDPAFAAKNLLDRTVDSSVRERAIFGQVNYDILSTVTVIVGGRYYDLKQRELTSVLVSAGGGPGSGPGRPSSFSVNGFIPRFNIAFQPNDRVNAYVQAAKGFRAGGNNDQTAAALANVTIPAGYNPDTLWNYEAGLKLRAPDGLFANIAAYYIDWKDIQIQLLASPPGAGAAGYPYTGNGGGAHVKGLEASLEARPTAGLSLGLSANYNDAELSRTNAPPASGKKGDRLPYVPRFSAAASADYDFPLSSDTLRGSIGGDITHVSARATDFNTTSAGYRRLPSNTLVSLRAGVKGDGWSAALVANNLFDQTRVINYTSLGFGITPDELYVNRPRTVSLRLTGQF